MKRILLLGSNISESVSPAFQNRAFERTRFDARYELLEFSPGKFHSVIQEIEESKDVLGFNITAPYKETILPFVSNLDSISKAIGAVNTVKISRGRMSGFNTDVDGILASFSKLGLKKKDRCIVLGAGGAARACVYASLKFGFQSISILNRSRDRAEQVKTHFLRLFPRADIEVSQMSDLDLTNAIPNANMLINALAGPFPFRADFSRARKDLKFLDLGYKNPSSILVGARDSKIDSIDGLFMLVEQGARSFEIWTGLKAPRRAMLFAAKRELSKPVREPFRSL